MHRLIVFCALAALAVIALISRPSADEFRVGDVAILQPWVRATARGIGEGSRDGSQDSAVFMVLANGGAVDDQLLAAASPAAQAVEFRRHQLGGRTGRDDRVAAIGVPAGGCVALRPGGLQMTLVGPVVPLAEGATVPLTLVFERAGEVTVPVPVRRIALIDPIDPAPAESPFWP